MPWNACLHVQVHIHCHHLQATSDLDEEVYRRTFDDFSIAFLSMFQIMTGDDWNKPQYELTDWGWCAAQAMYHCQFHSDAPVSSGTAHSDHNYYIRLCLYFCRWWALPLFLSFFFFFNFVLLNLFIAAVLPLWNVFCVPCELWVFFGPLFGSD